MGDLEFGVSRRRVLRSLPVAASAGLAGCTSVLESDDEPTSEPSTNTTETPSETETETENDTETETETETETPIDRPSIERQTIDRDRAAIVHVRRTVEGEIVWPSLESDNRIDPAVLGEWEGEDAVLRFYDDKSFLDTGANYELSGEYAAIGSYLGMRYETGEEYTFQYDVVDGGTQSLRWMDPDSGEQLAEFGRRRSGVDTRSIVQVAADVVILEANDPTTRGETLETGGAGSGFVVSSDGYIVTNAHVVGTHQDPEETLYARLAVEQRRALREAIEADFDVGEGEKLEIEEILFGKFMDYYAENAHVEDVSTDIGVLDGSAPPDDDFAGHSWPATIETAGTVIDESGSDPSWGRDVAILKVDREPLPTVPLGSTSDLGTGDRIFAIGYPDIGIQELFDDRSTTLEPTLTSGVVSARRRLNSGVNTIQTDADINHGNSGGPIYNDDGEVVGIATFGPADVEIQGIKFGLPIETATGFMGELGVENARGELDIAFEEGLEASWRDDCETVADRMETVLDLQPDHPYAQDFIDGC